MVDFDGKPTPGAAWNPEYVKWTSKKWLGDRKINASNIV